MDITVRVSFSGLNKGTLTEAVMTEEVQGNQVRKYSAMVDEVKVGDNWIVI